MKRGTKEYKLYRRIDFGTPEHRSATRRFITKYRLECSERREGDLCYPKQPIVYYVDPATPEWLKPWVRAGIALGKVGLAFVVGTFAIGAIRRPVPVTWSCPPCTRSWTASRTRTTRFRRQCAGSAQRPAPEAQRRRSSACRCAAGS